MPTEKQVTEMHERRQFRSVMSFASGIQEMLLTAIKSGELSEDLKKNLAHTYDMRVVMFLQNYWRISRSYDWREEFDNENVGYEFEDHGSFVVTHRWICDELGLSAEALEESYYDFIESTNNDPLVVTDKEIAAHERSCADMARLRKELEDSRADSLRRQ